MSDNTIRDQLAADVQEALSDNLEPKCCDNCDHLPMLGGSLHAAEVAQRLTACGWQRAHVIEDQEELQQLPRGVVVRAKDGTIAARFDSEYGVVFGDDRPFPWSVLQAPAVVLWEAEADR